MSQEQKKQYVEPELARHDQVQEVTAGTPTVVSIRGVK